MEPLSPHNAKQEFIDRLAASQADPISTLAALKEGWLLNDLDARLRFAHEITSRPPEELSEGTRKTIGVLGRLAVLFSRHGIVGPELQGLWLVEPRKELWFADERQSPLTVLGLGAQAEGPTKDNIWRVVSVAQSFLRPGPDDRGRNEAWDVIYSGAGDLNIPLHDHGDAD